MVEKMDKTEHPELWLFSYMVTAMLLGGALFIGPMPAWFLDWGRLAVAVMLLISVTRVLITHVPARALMVWIFPVPFVFAASSILEDWTTPAIQQGLAISIVLFSAVATGYCFACRSTRG
jgi:hypothetical protein